MMESIGGIIPTKDKAQLCIYANIYVYIITFKKKNI